MTSTYVADSVLADHEGTRLLDLATTEALTPTGIHDSPVFFRGFVDRPDVVAAGLLAVADVASTRYADPGLAQRIAKADPVVTGSGDRLRFESFSACNGVQARFDLLAGGLGGNRTEFGTTNVDINRPLRMALATISRQEALHLSVARDELRASTLDALHVEKKVNLPDRWVRGLAEVPLISAAMRLVGQIEGARLPSFMAALPRVSPPGPAVYLLPHRPNWLISHRPIAGAVPLAGASRVRGVERALRFATRLRIYTAETGASAWVFELPAARLTLTLSPDPYRGFSGEGSLLVLLANPESERLGRSLLGELRWSPRIEPTTLAARTGHSLENITAGLAWLAASGRLGFDLSEDAWFHRELPVESDKILRRNPRLASAQRIIDGGGVTERGDGWQVRGSDRRYLVSRELQCRCAWEDAHHGSRGPCKHVLAVILVRNSAPNRDTEP